MYKRQDQEPPPLPVAAIINWFGITDVKDLLSGENRQGYAVSWIGAQAVSYTHLRAHETVLDLVCRLLLEKNNKKKNTKKKNKKNKHKYK